MNLDRVGRWIIVALSAVVPPALAGFYFWHMGKPLWKALVEAPEIGFTALVLSATTWSELREARSRIPERTLALGEYACIFLIAASALFYGIHSKSLYLDPKEELFRNFLAWITFSLAATSLLVGTGFQLLIAKIEGKKRYAQD